MSKDILFAVSLFPYLGFLWFITRSGKMPRLALLGFYVLLIFVFVTIPAGIYAKVHYGKELANVDWLHGSAEFFLTLSNILVVLGFREAIVKHRKSSEPEG
jgi:heme A synthase